MTTIKRYANFDSSGNFSGFYSDDITSNIPSTAIEITDQQWQDLMAGEATGKSIALDANGSPTLAEPSLDIIKQNQIAVLSDSAATAYVAGFSSSALGSAHTYFSQITDQIKLSGAVTASQSPNLPANWTVLFWCADSNGKWTHAAHTATEIQQVLADALTVAEGISSKLGTLTDQVNAATTVSDVQAITW